MGKKYQMAVFFDVTPDTGIFEMPTPYTCLEWFDNTGTSFQDCQPMVSSGWSTIRTTIGQQGNVATAVGLYIHLPPPLNGDHWTGLVYIDDVQIN